MKRKKFNLFKKVFYTLLFGICSVVLLGSWTYNPSTDSFESDNLLNVENYNGTIDNVTFNFNNNNISFSGHYTNSSSRYFYFNLEENIQVNNGDDLYFRIFGTYSSNFAWGICDESNSSKITIVSNSNNFNNDVLKHSDSSFIATKYFLFLTSTYSHSYSNLNFSISYIPLSSYENSNVSYINSNLYDSLQIQYNQLHDDYEDLQNQYNQLHDDYEDLDEHYEHLEYQYNTLQSNYNTLQSNYNTLQRDYISLEADYDTYVATHSYTNQQYNDLSSRFSTLTDEYDTLLDEYQDLTNQYNSLQQLYNDLKNAYNPMGMIYNNADAYLFSYSESNTPYYYATSTSNYLAYDEDLEVNDNFNYITPSDFPNIEDYLLNAQNSGVSLYWSIRLDNLTNMPLNIDFVNNEVYSVILYNTFNNNAQSFDVGQNLYLSVNNQQEFEYNVILIRVYQKTWTWSTISTTNYNILYNQGFNEAMQQANIEINNLKRQIITYQQYIQSMQTNLEVNMRNLIWYIAETPFTSFKTIWNVDFLGLNIASFVSGLLSVWIVLFIIKKIFK